MNQAEMLVLRAKRILLIRAYPDHYPEDQALGNEQIQIEEGVTQEPEEFLLARGIDPEAYVASQAHAFVK